MNSSFSLFSCHQHLPSCISRSMHQISYSEESQLSDPDPDPVLFHTSLFPPFSHSAIAGLFIVFLSVKYHTQNSVLPYSYGGVRQHSYISTAINHAACPAAFHSPEERLTCGPSARCHSQKPPQVCKGLKAQSTAQNNLCLMRRLKIIWLGCFLTKPIR